MMIQLSHKTEPDLRIWIAEDDDEFREILGNSLVQEYREIRLFKDGREILEAMPGGDFDILIADLVMPGADGIQVLNEVKRFHPDRIVIIMTGYASIDSTIQAIRGGAYDYLRKPFKLEELEIVVKNASEKIALIRENKYLLQRLKETVEEMNYMKEIWEEHMSNRMGLYSMVSPDQKISEMELILNQLNPGSPDQDIPRREFSEKAMPALEKLIQFRKEGLIDEGEFIAFKKMLLKRTRS
jgi:FixJ family two-component response regulator